MRLFSIPLHTSWTVWKNDRAEGLELRFQHREQKSWHRYQDYDLFLCLWEEAGYRLTLTASPKVGERRQLAACCVQALEALPEKLSLFQAMSSPSCWREEDRNWIADLWEAERQRLGTRHFRQLEPPRPPVPVDFVPLKIPAGWEAAWNTLDCDYLQPDFLAKFLAPERERPQLHWERDIAMFVNKEPALCLDLEDWSGEDMRTAAFRVHLYRWTKEGPETLGEEMTRDPRRAVEKLEEFFLWEETLQRG